MSERTRLIVNADDFGLTAGVNRAIRDAHERGVLTSTTVLANGAYAGEAAELASRFPDLGVGVHVNLSLGAPICDPARIPSIVGDDGLLLAEGELLRRVARRQVRADEVRREVEAQVDRVRALGVEPSHWDGHRAVAFWPGLLGPAAAGARAAGLRRVRSPRVWLVAPGANGAAARWRWRLASPTRVASELNRQFGRYRLGRHFVSPGYRTSANLVRGVPDYAESWRAAFRNLPAGTVELVTHPGYLDDDLRGLTGLVEKRVVELDVLCAPDVAAHLTADGVRLISFRDLAP